MAYSYSIDDPAKAQKRTLAFALVVIIHIFFFWVLATGLGAKLVETVVGPVETKIIDELPDEKEPPPPPPDIEQPPPYVPPPEISVDTIAIDTAIPPPFPMRPASDRLPRRLRRRRPRTRQCVPLHPPRARARAPRFLSTRLPPAARARPAP